MTIRALFTGVLLASATAYAQQGPTLQQDPLSGLYTLSYTDEAGTRRSVQFFGRAQVAPEVAVAIGGQGPFQYAYTVKNGGSAKVPLFAIDVPCEERSTSSLRRPRLKVWNSVRARLPGPSVFYCGWTLGLRAEGDSGPPPGGQFGGALLFQSAWLPGISEAQAVGATGEIHFPGFSDETDESIDQLFLPTQHPRLLPAVSPKYPPSAFQDPAQGISIVLDELTQACSLGWIGRERGDEGRKGEARQEQDGERNELCGELMEKLEQAQKQLARGKKASATHALQEFLHELSEKKGERVNASAYALLFTNVNYLVTKVLGVVPEKDD